ncbi:hypothetical protein AURDEDRAFT_176319 [Auricularia subglabra TFB-10046 SS5]|nr:hypothetical protein AURDEDRAFT_176319 [Auricularia subglabra TFB-10046 SS5]
MASTSLYTRPPALSEAEFAKCARWASEMDRAVSGTSEPPMDEPPLHYEHYRQYNPAAIESMRAKTLQQHHREILNLRELRALQGGGHSSASSDSMPLRGFELFMRTLQSVQDSADRNVRTNMQTTLKAMQVVARPGMTRTVQRDNRRLRHDEDRRAGGRGDFYRPSQDRARHDRLERADRRPREQVDRAERRDRTERRERREFLVRRDRSEPSDRRVRFDGRPARRPVPADPPMRPRADLPDRPDTPFPRPVPVIPGFGDHDEEMRDASPFQFNFSLPAQDAAADPSAPAVFAAAVVVAPAPTPPADEPTGGAPVPAPLNTDLPFSPRQEEVFAFQPLAVLDAITPTTRITPTCFPEPAPTSAPSALVPESPASQLSACAASDYANSVTANLGAMSMAVEEYMAVEPALPLIFT